MNRKKPEILRIFLGIGLVAIMHCFVFMIGSVIFGLVINTPLAIMAAHIAIVSIFGIGVAQLIYVVPLIIYLVRCKAWGLMKGAIIGAIFTVLVNGGCWIFLYTVNY